MHEKKRRRLQKVPVMITMIRLEQDVRMWWSIDWKSNQNIQTDIEIDINITRDQKRETNDHMSRVSH